MLVAGPLVMELLFGDDTEYERGGLVLVCARHGALPCGRHAQPGAAGARAGGARPRSAGSRPRRGFVVFLLLPGIDDRVLQVEVGFLGRRARPVRAAVHAVPSRLTVAETISIPARFNGPPGLGERRLHLRPRGRAAGRRRRGGEPARAAAAGHAAGGRARRLGGAGCSTARCSWPRAGRRRWSSSRPRPSRLDEAARRGGGGLRALGGSPPLPHLLRLRPGARAGRRPADLPGTPRTTSFGPLSWSARRRGARRARDRLGGARLPHQRSRHERRRQRPAVRARPAQRRASTRTVEGGGRYALVSWPLAVDGRKRHAGVRADATATARCWRGRARSGSSCGSRVGSPGGHATTARARSARQPAASRSRRAAARWCRCAVTRRTSSAGGFICPKAFGIKQLHEDPDRLTKPLVRRDGELVEASWDEAFAEIDARLVAAARAARAQRGGRVHRQPGRPQPLGGALRHRVPEGARQRRTSSRPAPLTRCPSRWLGGPDVRRRPERAGARRRPHRAPADPRRQPAGLERQPAHRARHARAAAGASASAAARSWWWTHAAPAPPRRPTSTTSSGRAATRTCCWAIACTLVEEGLEAPGRTGGALRRAGRGARARARVSARARG